MTTLPAATAGDEDNNGFGKAVLYVSLSIIAISLLFYIYRIFQSCKLHKVDKFFSNVESMTFPLASTFLSIIVLFIYGVVLGRCPGLIRSNILLTPLAILSTVGLLDWFVQAVLDVRHRQLLNIVVVALVFTVFVRTATSFSGPEKMLMSKPVLNRLASYDPSKVWNIGFSKKMWPFHVGFLYYKQFDRKFNIVPANKCNAYICRIAEVPKDAILFDDDYFSKSGYYSIVLGITPKKAK